jgi:hypothetical protein
MEVRVVKDVRLSLGMWLINRRMDVYAHEDLLTKKDIVLIQTKIKLRVQI